MNRSNRPSSPIGSRVKGVVEKPKNFKKSWIKIINYIKNFWFLIIIALISAVIATILQIIGPDKIGTITDEIGKALPKYINGEFIPGFMDMTVIKQVAFSLLIIYIVSALLSLVQNIIMSSVTQKISKTLRTDVSNKINKLPLKFFDEQSHGDTLSIMSNDIDTIGQSMNQSIGNLVTSIVMIVGVLFMMFYKNWALAFIAVGTSFIGFILMGLIIRKSQKYFKAQQIHLGDINGHIEEIYSSHNVVKVYNGKNKSIEEFEEVNDQLFASAWKSQFFSGLMMPLMAFIGNLGYVSIIIVGAILTLNGTVSFGVIIAFLIYVRLFNQPLSQIAQAINNLQRTAAASERVFGLLDEQEMEDESNKNMILSNVRGEVEFKNVNFGYSLDRTIIHNFSIRIKQGQKVAIVGPTGAGKTTIVNLLMRFYDISSGDILIDGMSINDVSRENVHDQFSMVLQDSWMFEGSLKENITYSKKNVSDEEVINACKKAGIHHFIQTLPEGYNTIINDKVNLSEGQKQLITIARAMIQNSPLLILDEATSSVDTRTEKIVQEAMDKLTEGRTSFVIAHRLSTIKNSDIIFVMKDGNVIESGNHEQLLNEKGFYSELYSVPYVKD